MAIAVYARVSTDEQARNETVQHQIDFANKYVELHNLGEIEFFIDEGVSGVIPLEERKDGRRLLDAVRQGFITEVLLYRLDRLGRAVRVILNAVHEIEKHARVKSMTEPFDTADPTGRFLLTILAGVADLERETIKERTYAGLRRTVARGKWPGVAPLGYMKNKDGLLEPNEEQINGTSFTPAGLIRLIFRLVGEQHYTTIQVAQYLNALKDLPPVIMFHEMGKRENKNGWSTGYIYNIITNTVYIGERVFKSKQGEPIVCNVPSLISEELWRKTQAVIKEHSRLNWYKPKYEYLLTGLIRCGVCGKAYAGRSVERYKKSGPYMERSYLCNSKRHSINKSPCGNPNVNADKTENLVWEFIVDFVKNPGARLEEFMAALPDTGELALEIESLRNTVAGKENEKQHILDLYRRGIIKISDVEEQARRIEEEKKVLEKRLAEVTAQLDHIADSAARTNEIYRLMDVLSDKIEKPLTWDEKRRIVMGFIKEVIIYPGTGPGKPYNIKIRTHFNIDASDHESNNSADSNNEITEYKLFNLSVLNNLRALVE